MPWSDYIENAVLNHIRPGGATYTQPAAWYVELYTATPNDAGGGTPVSGGSYARAAAAFATAASGTAGSIANTSAVTFPTATGAWGTVTHFAIFDASTAGNMIAYGALGASKTVGSGDTAQFAIGQLTVTLD